MSKELKNITDHRVAVFINDTFFLTNHQQELSQWPRNFQFEYTFVPRPQVPPLKSIKATIDTSAQALDVIMTEEDTVANFLANNYKIFINNV